MILCCNDRGCWIEEAYHEYCLWNELVKIVNSSFTRVPTFPPSLLEQTALECKRTAHTVEILEKRRHILDNILKAVGGTIIS